MCANVINAKEKFKRRTQGTKFSNLQNAVLMGRQRIVQIGMVLGIQMNTSTRKLFRSAEQYKKIADKFIKIARILENLKQTSNDPKSLDVVKKYAKKVESELEKILKSEKNEPSIINASLKTISTIESIEVDERETMITLISDLVNEGFPADVSKKELNEFKKELKQHLEDLKQVESAFALLAGLEMGYSANKTISALKNFLRVGRIHNKWFFVPVISQTKRRYQGRQLALNHHKHLHQALKNLIAEEEKGHAKMVEKELKNMMKILFKEDKHFEDFQGTIDTEIKNYINKDLEVSEELTKLLGKAKRDFPDLVRMLKEYKTKIDHYHADFANLLKSYRRGNEIMVQRTQHIITQANALLARIDDKQKITARQLNQMSKVVNRAA